MNTLSERLVALLCVLLLVSFCGCTAGGGGTPAGNPDVGNDDGIAGEGEGEGEVSEIVAEISAKALDVAEQIGAGGYGGAALEDYEVSVEEEIDFSTDDDLAPDGARMTIRFHNQSGQQCAFQFQYVASHWGVEENSEEVTVEAGEEMDVELPCSEVIGLGPLGTPGGTGCVLGDGQEIANTMAVPGFLGADFACGETHQYRLMADAADLDGDGDTEELICTSAALERHMNQHQHGNGGG